MEHKKDSFYKTDKPLTKGQEYSMDETSASTEKDDSTKGTLPANVSDYSFDIFLNKKTEKLTTALYMVTSFLSDNEPLKWKLRGRGIDLLSNMSTVRNSCVSEVENIFADYSPSIEEIVSLLEVAMASKLISEMNFAILKKEYLSLNSFIISDKHADKRTGRFVFPQSFFIKDDALSGQLRDSTFPTPANLSNEGINRVSKKYNKGHNEDHVEYIGQIKTPNTQASLLKKQKNNYSTGRFIKDKIKGLQKNKEGKIDRRATVLKLFKKNKELTIKDVSCEVSGCSEKTIQRELLALVSIGVLNKKGERRWSKYSLK